MKPITAAAVESDPRYVYVDEAGRESDHYDITFTADNWERIRQGYACMRCWEPQRKNAYSLGPTERENHLPGCEYTGDGIRRRQRDDIAKEFYGTKWIGPKQKLEDTIAEDDERRRKYQQDTGLKPGISVPSWVKL